MSSLNATQADGYYIPPEYLDSGAYKKQSLKKFNGDKGHNQYLLNSVVRFELPYDGFCVSKSCGAHVGKGTRFNAHKAHVDDYFTTKIWEFTMTCRACTISKFAIRTNPRMRCFDYCSGIKKKVEEFDTVEAGTLGVIDTDEGNGIQTFSTKINRSNNDNDNEKKGSIIGIQSNNNIISAIDKLQQEKIGERKSMTDRDAMELLMKHNDTTMYDDAVSNSKLRSNYRVVRKAKKRRLGEAHAKGLGMGIELYDSTKEDKTLALSAFGQKSRDKKSRLVEKKKFGSIRASSIFNDQPSKNKSVSLKQSQNYLPNECKRQDECKEKKVQKQTLVMKNGAIIRHKTGDIKGNDAANNNKKQFTSEGSILSAAKSQETSLSYLVDAYTSDSD